MSGKYRLSGRSGLKGLSAMGAAALFGGAGSAAGWTAAEPPKQPGELRTRIFSKVWDTPLLGIKSIDEATQAVSVIAARRRDKTLLV